MAQEAKLCVNADPIHGALRLAGRHVFVTGATGFIGRHLVNALVLHGADVHALRRTRRDLTPSEAEEPANSRVTQHNGDLLEPEQLTRTLLEISPDTVFHLAAYGARPGERDADQMFAVNVAGAINLWRSLPPSVIRVVAAGTSREYARASRAVFERDPCGPVSLYPATKHAGVTLLGALAAQEQRAVTVLRLFGAYGPGDTSERIIPFTIARLLAGESVPLTSGRQRYDFAYVDDHVSAFVLAATAPYASGLRIYNIGSGVPCALREAVEAVAECVGGPGAVARLQFDTRPNADDGLVICADISAARNELGYSPDTSLRAGIAMTVGWWRQAWPRPLATK